MKDIKRKQLYIISIFALIILAAIVSAAVILQGKGSQEGPGGNNRQETPQGQLLVQDIYEGERLIPKFDLPKNQYDKEKFHEENGIITYSDLDAALGVDVSEYQGDIDWAQVKGAGVEFAILRLGHRGYTQGLMYVDEKFEKNLEEACAAGLQVGVYFFSQAITEAEAVAEADFVLETLGNRQLRYPVIFDWERPMPSESLPAKNLRAYQITGEQVTSFAAAFCRRIKDAGRIPAVYFNKTMAYELLDLSKLKDYDFWYAEYQSVPSLYYDFRIWQYTENGTIPGIGNVDLNICFKAY